MTFKCKNIFVFESANYRKRIVKNEKQLFK